MLIEWDSRSVAISAPSPRGLILARPLFHWKLQEVVCHIRTGELVARTYRQHQDCELGVLRPRGHLDNRLGSWCQPGRPLLDDIRSYRIAARSRVQVGKWHLPLMPLDGQLSD